MATKTSKGGAAAPKTKAPKAGGAGVATLPVEEAPKASIGKPRMQRHYEETIRPRLAKQFGLKNPNQVPRLTKIVLNVGLGEAAKTPRLVEVAAEELAQVTGQKAVITRAKKAIANFNLRAGNNHVIGTSEIYRRRSPTATCAPACRWAAG